MSSPSISARGTTGMRFARAAATSGFDRLTALETTTTSAAPKCSAEWPMKIVHQAREALGNRRWA